jgi:hypothetical protein
LGALVLVLLAAALLLAFLAWPYATLWRLDRAARSGDPAALADLVDLDAVRGEIKRKLNKDADSTIGDLSDPFIRWLGEGIEVMGNDAIDRLVTLPWVQARLLDPRSGDGTAGFLRQVTYAFFDAPDGFVVRIGPATGNPVHLRLTLRSLRWRLSAAYY